MGNRIYLAASRSIRRHTSRLNAQEYMTCELHEIHKATYIDMDLSARFNVLAFLDGLFLDGLAPNGIRGHETYAWTCCLGLLRCAVSV